jgi:hypothetical protein
MDVEMLFSREPFLAVDRQASAGLGKSSTGGDNAFSIIEPNATLQVPLPGDQEQTRVEIPQRLASRNLIIEVTSQGLRRSLPYYRTDLLVEMRENYGQLRVLHAQTRQPLDTVYIKTYARLKDGSVKFYKDGYTDLRGIFRYADLTNDMLDQTQQLAILILSPTHGAAVRGTHPPQQ